MDGNSISIAMEFGAFGQIGDQTEHWTDSQVMSFWIEWTALEGAGAEMVELDRQKDKTYIAAYSDDFRKHCAKYGVTLV